VKIITINHCGECSHNRFYLSEVKNYCELKNLRQITNPQKIPQWCPLEDKR